MFPDYPFLVTMVRTKYKEARRSMKQATNARSSRPEVFCNGVLRNFIKVKGKHLCQSLFFNIAAGPRPATLL